MEPTIGAGESNPIGMETTGEMTICSFCGHEVPADAPYCSFCGEEIKEVKKYVFTGI